MRTLMTTLILLGLASGTRAQTPIALTLGEREARGEVRLPGGLAAELTIAFEEVVGMREGALEVTAEAVRPRDPRLSERMPGRGLVTVPPSFPVLVRIEPSPSSALSFSGVVTVSFHTHNLHLNPSVPLALYTAHAGGHFRDITRSEGIGSYRAQGSGGGFSEFLIVVDRRPSADVVAQKFGAVEALLFEHEDAIPQPLREELDEHRREAWRLHEGGDTVGAIERLRGLAAAVRANSGLLPDVWRAHDARVNVAGTLRAAVDTLVFSLSRTTGRTP